MSTLFYIFALAMTLSLAVCGFMVAAGVGDVPDHRSSHKRVTATSAGVGFIAALGGTCLLLPGLFSGAQLSPLWPPVLALIWMVAMLGLIDDLHHLSARLKFPLLIIISGLAVWVIGPVQSLPVSVERVEIPYFAAFAGSVLWVFVAANAVNFMDGANGLMMTVMTIAFLALALICVTFSAPEIAFLPIVLAGALIGGTPYNLRQRARIFSGDVGSLTAGFGFAITVLWLCRTSPQFTPVYLGPVLILPFLTDVLLTLLRRLFLRRNILQAHNEHMYQRLIRSGWSHISVTSLYGIGGLFMAGYALFGAIWGLQSLISFVMLPASILAMLYLKTNQVLRGPN